MKIKLKNNIAFTLAEVLITLGIIGVVAGMTIPTLINNINKQAYISQFKVTYGILSQATNMVFQEYGGSLENAFTTQEEIINAYKRYLKYSRDCSVEIGLSKCWPDPWHAYNGDVQGAKWNNDAPGLVLANGSLIHLSAEDFACGGCLDPSWNCSNGKYSWCHAFKVDVNGFNKPNKLGVDEFEFIVYKTRKLLPLGLVGEREHDNCGATASHTSSAWPEGIGCGGWIMRGIDYDMK